MTIEMEKVWNITWNISTSIMAIMAVLVLIGQIIAGSEIGIMAFAAIVCIIFNTRHGENAHNG